MSHNILERLPVEVWVDIFKHLLPTELLPNPLADFMTDIRLFSTGKPSVTSFVSSTMEKTRLSLVCRYFYAILSPAGDRLVTFDATKIAPTTCKLRGQNVEHARRLEVLGAGELPVLPESDPLDSSKENWPPQWLVQEWPTLQFFTRGSSTSPSCSPFRSYSTPRRTFLHLFGRCEREFVHFGNSPTPRVQSTDASIALRLDH